MKNNLLRLIVVSMLLLCAPTSSTAQSPEGEKIRAGALLPFTGGYAPYGKLIFQALQLGAGDGIEWIVEDSGTFQGPQALSAVNRLLAEEQIQFAVVLGIDDAEVVATLFNRKKVPLIVAWDSGDRITELGDYIFSAGYETASGGRKAAEYLSEVHNAKTVAIMAEESSYNRTAIAAFQERASHLGMKVSSSHWHALRDTNFRNTLMRIKGEKPDGLYLIMSLPESHALAVRQMEEMKLNLPFVTNELIVPAPDQMIPAKQANGCGTWFSSDGTEELMSAIEKRFHERPWNHGPAVVGFESGQLVRKVTQATDGDIYQALINHLGPTRRADKKFSIWCLNDTVN